MQIGCISYVDNQLCIQSVDGQVYRLKGKGTYKGKDGKNYPTLTWRSMDPETGEYFEWGTPLAFDPNKMTRRAPHRAQKGVRIKMLHREPPLWSKD